MRRHGPAGPRPAACAVSAARRARWRNRAAARVPLLFSGVSSFCFSSPIPDRSDVGAEVSACSWGLRRGAWRGAVGGTESRPGDTACLVPAGGGDTCVTDLTGGAKTALVIYRGGIRMPQGESCQRSWRGRPMTRQGPLGKLQGFYMLRTLSELSPPGPSGRGLRLGRGVHTFWNLCSSCEPRGRTAGKGLARSSSSCSLGPSRAGQWQRKKQRVLESRTSSSSAL